MAECRPCLVRVKGVCNGDQWTTVAAHSNQGKHGKGMGIKAEDCYTVWACSACHAWLDQGSASQEDRVNAWDWAFERQVREWQKIVEDPEGGLYWQKICRDVLRHLGVMR